MEQTAWACPGSASQRLCHPGRDTVSLTLTVLIWEMGMNSMAVNRIVGRMKSDATGEGRLVALARVLCLLLAPQLSPLWAEL